jgi:DNA-binding transcriptional ArsR family regulator
MSWSRVSSMEDRAELPRPRLRHNGRIDSIEVSLKSDIICSNINRVAILYLLKDSPRKEMQAEKLAQSLGVSHRTALYHLDVLENYELVQVKGFRKKGQKMLRSVWGLNSGNSQTERIFKYIGRKFPEQEIGRMISSGTLQTAAR